MQAGAIVAKAAVVSAMAMSGKILAIAAAVGGIMAAKFPGSKGRRGIPPPTFAGNRSRTGQSLEDVVGWNASWPVINKDQQRILYGIVARQRVANATAASGPVGQSDAIDRTSTSKTALKSGAANATATSEPNLESDAATGESDDAL